VKKTYRTGLISDDVPLKDTVGQLFNCNNCCSMDIYCVGLSGTGRGMVVNGKCKGCGKTTSYLIHGELLKNKE
jgi:hypothetical protein